MTRAISTLPKQNRCLNFPGSLSQTIGPLSQTTNLCQRGKGQTRFKFFIELVSMYCFLQYMLTFFGFMVGDRLNRSSWVPPLKSVAQRGRCKNHDNPKSFEPDHDIKVYSDILVTEH